MVLKAVSELTCFFSGKGQLLIHHSFAQNDLVWSGGSVGNAAQVAFALVMKRKFGYCMRIKLVDSVQILQKCAHG